MSIPTNEVEALHLEGKEITENAETFLGAIARLTLFIPAMILIVSGASGAIAIPDEPPAYYQRQLEYLAEK